MVGILQFIYKCLLTLNATLLVVFIYLVKCNVFLKKIGKYSVVVYIIGIVLFTFICLMGMKILPDDEMKGIQDISLANDNYMPSYLGYFFVALSIPYRNWLVFGIVFGVIYIFTFFSQSLYFNPLFLLFGYNFYYVTSQNQTKIFVISRTKGIRNAKNLCFDHLKRVNEFTFIDKEW